MSSWREEIERACAAVPAAEAERARVLRAANDAGLSTREIAKVAGTSVNASTIWRWMGEKNPEAATSLDSEADLDGTLKAAAAYITNPDESGLRLTGSEDRL